MDNRKLWNAFLLASLLVMERGAYYGARSAFFLLRDREGLDLATAGRNLTLITLVGTFTALVGGALAIATGPRACVVLGALVSVVAYFMLAADASALSGGLVLALGAGILKPAPWAILADEASTEPAPSGIDVPPKNPGRFALVASFGALFYAAINAGALVGPPFAHALEDRFGFSKMFGATGAFMLVGAGFAVVVAVRGRAGSGRAETAPVQPPYRAQGAPATSPRGVATTAGVAGVAIACGLAIPVNLATTVAPWEPQQYPSMARAALMAVNPVVVLAVSTAAFAIWLAPGLLRRPKSLATPLAVGLTICAFGQLILTATFVAGGPTVLGTAVQAIGEPLVVAVGAAYASLALDRKLATLAVASYFSATSLASLLAQRVVAGADAPFVQTTALAFTTFLLIAAAVVAFAAGKRIHAAFAG